MNQRGVTLVELLIAILVSVIVVVALGSFYVKTQNAFNQANTQAALQRQGTLVQQEMARVVLAANGLLASTCGPVGATDSLPVQIPSNTLPDATLSGGGYVCIYLASGQIVECRFTSPATTTCIANTARNLLLGAPIPDPVVGAIPAGLAVMFNRVGGTAVDVNFALTAGVVGPLSFGTRLTVRN
jgi:prepilin-type N-terminal cleavage/methylation domain-containing protein